MTIIEIEPRWLRRSALVFATLCFYLIVLPIIIIPATIWDLTFRGRRGLNQGLRETASIWQDIRDIWTK
jgi:hypothetical protein